MPYMIKNKTFAIIPKGKKSQIIEEKNTITINTPVIDIITNNCCLNGSTLEGRQKGSQYILGTKYKNPIALNDSIILIPTHSSRNEACIWLNLSSIVNYKPNLSTKVRIEFKNHKKITLNISYTIFDKQVLRATRLESIIKTRLL